MRGCGVHRFLRGSFFLAFSLRQNNILSQPIRHGILQLLTLQPLVTKQAIGVPVRAITQHGDDGMVRAQLLGDLLGRHDIECTARSQIQTLLVQTPINHLYRLFVRDVQSAIQLVDLGLQIVRDPSLPNALGDTPALPLLQLPAGADVRVENRPRRVGQERLDPPPAHVLEVPRRAGQRAPRPRGAREGVDPAAGLRPDLRARGLDVRAPVRNVVELVRPHGPVLGVLGLPALRVPFGLPVVVLRVLPRDRGDRVDFRAQQPQEVDLALRLRVGHVYDQLVPAGAADVREADARVARRALDHGPAPFEQPAFLGVLDDVQGRAVLDAAPGVLEFGFP